MSSLKVLQTKVRLKALFESFLDLRDISETDKDRETKILSRCLAAFAIYQETGCTAEEACFAVWDGSDDNGIDAAFCDPVENRVVLVQSKWIHTGSGEPEARDLRTFVDGITCVVEQENDGFHNRLQARLSNVQKALQEVGTTVRLIVITTGKSSISTHGTRVMDSLVAKLNGNDGTDLVSWTIFGLEESYGGLATGIQSGKIQIEATLYDWSFFANPHAAYFGLIDGLQVKCWWTAHGNKLVAKNIRHSLGSTDVNEAISQTARTSPEKFWYFNNGITLVADEANRAPAVAGARSAGNFSFLGASIVNGAQTVSTLGRITQDDQLGRVRIPIRIVLLKNTPEGFGGEVTRTNNLQNRVDARDFVAQDPEQARLRLEMSIEDVNYQYLRGERFTPTDNSTDLIEVTTALACAADDVALAVIAKTALGRFYADLNRAPYKTIFNAGVRGARAFNAVLVQRKVESWIEVKKGELDQQKGLSWGLLVHGNRVLESGIFERLGTTLLDRPIAEFRKELDSRDLGAVANPVFDAMATILARDYANRFMAVLFKSPSEGKAVLEKALEELQREGSLHI